MFTEQQLQKNNKHRTTILLPSMVLAVLAMLLYFSVVGNYREVWVNFVGHHLGETAAEFSPALMVLPGLLFFLVPIVLAENYVKRFASICPSCSTDITKFTKWVLKTRCCPSCDKRVVSGGKVHHKEASDRLHRLRQRSFLKNWLWAWPAIACLSLGWHWLDPFAFHQCPQVLFTQALIGTTAAGWAVFRVDRRKYLPHFIISSLLLAVGSVVFWYAL